MYQRSFLLYLKFFENIPLEVSCYLEAPFKNHLPIEGFVSVSSNLEAMKFFLYADYFCIFYKLL